MFENSLKKYFTFIFLSTLVSIVTICKNESIRHGIKKFQCGFKKSDDNLMDDLYYADLMNHFEDYDYYEWEYYNDYIKETGNINLDIDGVNNEIECEDDNEYYEENHDEKEKRNQIFIELIVEGINKDKVYFNQEFYDI
jgi:hypothetical protein